MKHKKIADKYSIDHQFEQMDRYLDLLKSDAARVKTEAISEYDKTIEAFMAAETR